MIGAEAPEGQGGRRAHRGSYVTDEQRSPSGCIGGEGEPVISRRVLRWLRILSEASRLDPHERRLAATAGLLLPFTALGLRVLGLRRIEALLGRVPGRGHEDLPAARAVARLVRGTAAALPLPTTCLSRALVLRWLLEREGLAADLRLGVGRPGGAFAAHAWIEHGGVALAEADDLSDRFSAFPSPKAP